MWEDLLEQSSDHGFRIGSIWIADVAALGASGIVNEPLLGDDRKNMRRCGEILHVESG